MFVMKRSSNDPVTHGGNSRPRQTMISSLTSMSASQEQRLVRDPCVYRVTKQDCTLRRTIAKYVVATIANSIFELFTTFTDDTYSHSDFNVTNIVRLF